MPYFTFNLNNPSCKSSQPALDSLPRGCDLVNASQASEHNQCYQGTFNSHALGDLDSNVGVRLAGTALGSSEVEQTDAIVNCLDPTAGGSQQGRYPLQVPHIQPMGTGCNPGVHGEAFPVAGPQAHTNVHAQPPPQPADNTMAQGHSYPPGIQVGYLLPQVQGHGVATIPSLDNHLESQRHLEGGTNDLRLSGEASVIQNPFGSAAQNDLSGQRIHDVQYSLSQQPSLNGSIRLRQNPNIPDNFSERELRFWNEIQHLKQIIHMLIG